jgi:hypothetical protein
MANLTSRPPRKSEEATPFADKVFDRLPYWSPGMLEYPIRVKCFDCGRTTFAWNWQRDLPRCAIHRGDRFRLNSTLRKEETAEQFKRETGFQLPRIPSLGLPLEVTQPPPRKAYMIPSVIEFGERRINLKPCEFCGRSTLHCDYGHCQVHEFKGTECGLCIQSQRETFGGIFGDDELLKK